jgi:hypothetical protein
MRVKLCFDEEVATALCEAIDELVQAKVDYEQGCQQRSDHWFPSEEEVITAQNNLTEILRGGTSL